MSGYFDPWLCQSYIQKDDWPREAKQGTSSEPPYNTRKGAACEIGKQRIFKLKRFYAAQNENTALKATKYHQCQEVPEKEYLLPWLATSTALHMLFRVFLEGM